MHSAGSMLGGTSVLLHLYAYMLHIRIPLEQRNLHALSTAPSISGKFVADVPHRCHDALEDRAHSPLQSSML